MKRIAISLASAALGAALVAGGPASAAEVGCWYNGGLHPCVYYTGYPYAYPPGYGYQSGAGLGTGLGGLLTAPVTLAQDVTAGVTGPLMTGRSVAVSTAAAPAGTAGPGNYCGTPVRTCRLIEPGWLGTGCSCWVPGGRARGFVE